MHGIHSPKTCSPSLLLMPRIAAKSSGMAKNYFRTCDCMPRKVATHPMVRDEKNFNLAALMSGCRKEILPGLHETRLVSAGPGLGPGAFPFKAFQCADVPQKTLTSTPAAALGGGVQS